MEERRIFFRSLRVSLISLAIVLIWVIFIGIFNMGPYVLILLAILAKWVLIPGILLTVSASLLVTALVAFVRSVRRKKIPFYALGGIVLSIALAVPLYHVTNIYLGPKYSVMSLINEKKKPDIGKVHLEWADDFKNGEATVRENGKNYLIDKSGKKLSSSNNRIVVNYKKKWEPGVKTGTGFDDIEPEEGFEKRAGLNQNVLIPGTAGIIDNSSGQFITQYDKVEPFYEEVAIAYDRGRAGVINKHGRWIIEPGVYKEIGPFQYGMARVRSGDSYGFIDTAGRLAIGLIYDDVREFNDKGVAPVKKYRGGGHNWGLISRDGAWVLEPKYEEMSRYQEGFYVVKDARRPLYGYCDWSGYEIVKPQYFHAKLFHDGLAAVSLAKEGWGYINQGGAVVIPFQFYEANDFHEGLAAVRVDTRGSMLQQLFLRFFLPTMELPGRWGYIDKAGTLVIARVVNAKAK